MATAATPWSSVFNTKNGNPIPGRLPSFSGRMVLQLKLSSDGVASVSDASESASPFYMEARSIVRCAVYVRERPANWKQIGSRRGPIREFHGVTDAGIVTKPLLGVRLENGKVRLSGSFGVFFPGRLVAHFYNEHGSMTETMPLGAATPTNLVVLDTEIAPRGKPTRVSLHLEDQDGLDRGTLQEVPIRTGKFAEMKVQNAALLLLHAVLMSGSSTDRH